jgi:hypothetical protein
MIARSEEFADVNAVNLLVMILKICEQKDVTEDFANAFGRPLGRVMSEHLQMLLMSAQVTPKFLRTLLTVADPTVIKECQRHVCNTITKVYERDTPVLAQVIESLAQKQAFENLATDFIERILATGAEATSMLRALLKADAIDPAIYGKDSEILLGGLLQSMSQTEEAERLTALHAMKLFEEKAQFSTAQFPKVYTGLIERLKDHMIPIRVCAAEVLGRYLPKCIDVEDVPGKLPEIVISIDDEAEEIRTAVADLCRCIANVDQWKPLLIDIIEKQSNYHSEASDVCAQLLRELKT